jgi:hypothetical protein
MGMTNETTPETSAKVSIIEQHVGTLLQTVMIGLLGWSLMTTVDLRTDVGIMKAKMEAVQSTLAQGTSDRYRGSDAVRDLKIVWDEFARHDLRLKTLEEDCRALKRK